MTGKPQLVCGPPAAALDGASPDHAAAPVPEWVMLARTGRWLGHPTVRQVVDRQALRSALDYFRRHYAAHGTDLVVDYHHASLTPAGGAPAAGWVRKMDLRNGDTELWGRVMWTAEAAAAIARRKYRYLSPVFRFNAPDRRSGRPVPMQIHSVALTNTPFLTELKSLNEAAAAARCPGAGESVTLSEGQPQMSILNSISAALDTEPAELAATLGLDAGAADGEIAQALVDAARTARTATAVANALGVEINAGPATAEAAIRRLQVGAAAMREKLGLPADAGPEDVLNALESLRAAGSRSKAEELVDDAIRAGRIPPAHRAFYLREALNDLSAAEQVINALPVLTVPPTSPAGAPRPALTDAERHVCRQLGLTAEQMAGARPAD